jgi:hypothetical protein
MGTTRTIGKGSVVSEYNLVNWPATVYGAPDALARVAVGEHGPAMLLRGGSPQRAARLVASGVPVEKAARVAAAQGKGHIGETLQAAGFAARSGALQRPDDARPNPVANDPSTDVQVRRGAKVVYGAQLKVGSDQYVLRAIEKGGYTALVANAEARETLLARGLIDADEVSDHLGYQGIESGTLTAAECEETAVDLITRILRREAPNSELGLLLHSLRAGAHDGAISFTLALVAEVADCVYTGRPFEGRRAGVDAAKSGMRSLARTSLQTRIMVGNFMSQARAAFSGRLIHRVARSALVAGAVAEVVLETAIDLLAVLRSEMTMQQWLARAGVHVTTAAAGAAGVALACAVTQGAPWWAQLGVCLLAGYGGAQLGRAVGKSIFDPKQLPMSEPTS